MSVSLFWAGRQQLLSGLWAARIDRFEGGDHL